MNRRPNPVLRFGLHRGGIVLALAMFVLSFALSSQHRAEARPLAVPGVTITSGLPDTVFIGEPINFTVAFDNNGTSEGYGPFIDIIFPVNGADGAQNTNLPLDGISFVSADYLGVPLNITQLTFPGSGGVTCVAHPYAVDTTGTPLQVCGNAGDVLVVIELPFGSFVVDQPAVNVAINASLSQLADLNTPLTFQMRGGYRFGATPLNDFATDPSIVSGWVNDSITPILIRLTKVYNGPEDETATGPNFPHSYTIQVDIANNQTVTNLDVIDELAFNQQYLGYANAIPGPTTLIDQPLTPGAQNPPNNDLDVRFSSVTGGLGSNDASLDVQFFIPQYDANGGYVLPPATGDDAISCNNARAIGDWTPIDPRDVGGTDNAVADPAGCEHQLEDQSIAIQKGVANISDPNNTPGDVLEYTLQFQISDYFAFQNIVITDVFSDGQRFDATFIPTLTLSEHGANTSGSFDLSNFTVFLDSPGTGETTVTFRVSNELISRSLDGQVLGGCVPAGGTGGPDPACAVYNSGATTGTIRFRTIIQENFSDTYLPGDPSVDQGDILWNDVIIAGDVLAVSNLTPTGFNEEDDSHAQIEIARGDLQKSIYGINGVTPAPSPVRVAPADTVTFRLRYFMPNSDFENFYIIDYLPLPVFSATEVSGPFNNTICGLPAAGTACLGPDDTYHLLPSAIVPTITTNGTANSVRFDYGDYDVVGGPSSVVDILFTVTVEGDPFADGLYLTNQARAHEGSTNNGDVVDDSIVQIQLTEPVLAITKGVVATDNPAGVFTPAAVGPVAFSAPGGGCPRFTPTIHSTNLTANPINSNLSGVDAGDRVTFAIVIENTGSGLTGAFDVRFRDTLPSGFAIPGSGLNLCVTDGTGLAMPYTDLGGGLFGTGLELTDPGPTNPDAGAVDGYDATDGHNIVIVTYDLELTAAVEPLQTLTNTATLFNFAGQEGGPDHTATDLTDDANVQVATPAVDKQLVGTNQPFTTGNDVAIGEIVTYSVTVTVPEGTTSGVTLTDILDPGLAFVGCDSVVASSVDLTTSIGTWATACNPPTNPTVGPEPTGSVAPADQGRRLVFDFGTVTNANRNNAVAETITLTYRAVVLNAPGNNRGVGRNNAATWAWSGGSVSDSAPNVTIVEPTLTVQKDASPTTGDAGDTITFTIVVRNQAPSNSDSFNVNWQDIIPSGLTYVAGSLTHTAGLSPTTLSDGGAPTLTATWDTFALNQTSTLTFQATINGTVIPGQTITNTATVTWTSLPGGVGTPQSPYNDLSCERTGNPADCGGSENDYTTSDPADVVVYQPQPQKSIVQTSEGHTGSPGGVVRLAVGEVVRYRLVVRVAETTMTDLYLFDRLSNGLQFLDDGTAMAAFVCSGGPGCITSSDPLIAGLPVIAGDETTLATITPTFALPDAAVSRLLASDDDAYTNGSDVYFKFLQVVNNDRDANQEFLVIEFNALVLNVIGNQSNTALTNDFQLFINGSLNATSPLITARVAEPSFTLTKTITVAPQDAGDPLVYRLTITNNSSGNNASAGFDLHITDTLNAFLVLDGVTVTVPGYATFTDASAAPNVDVIISRINPGDVAYVDIAAHVGPLVPNGQIIPNAAHLTFTGLPGTGTCPNPTGSCTPGSSGAANGERNGETAPGTLNDYFRDANVNLTLFTPAFDKLTPNPAAYTVGDVVTYNLLVTLREGTTNDLAVFDNLPVGLIYLNSSVITTVAGSGGILTQDYAGAVPTPTVTCTGSCGNGDDMLFTFGNQVTTDDNNVNNNSFVVQIQARVLDLMPTVVDGAVLSNVAELRYTNPNTGNSVTLPDAPENISIIEPRIETIKTVTPLSGVQAGDVLTYT
ncbi:MAG: isopeptide-forming domain-containing fimbrial protein, partial [Longilinea sp.]|nr:isopeptide-forming domain-containing fimbrial protein [Longilinea sp.]